MRRIVKVAALVVLAAGAMVLGVVTLVVGCADRRG
jgi:hypothetical protein